MFTITLLIAGVVLSGICFLALIGVVSGWMQRAVEDDDKFIRHYDPRE